MSAQRLSVRSMTPGDIPAAAELLAARWPGLSGFQSAEDFARLIEPSQAGLRSDAVVAVRGPRICGFLAGEKQLFAPDDFPSIYAEPRSVGVLLHSHAVSRAEDAADVYGAMYAELATHWVRQGMLVHSIGLNAADRETADAWFSLGFGQKSVCAVRETTVDDALVEAASRAEHVEVVAGDHSPDLLHEMHRKLMRYQRAAPMFWPYSGEQDSAVRDVRAGMMSAHGGTAFVAMVDGRAAGMLVFAPPAFLSPLLVGPDTVYLWEAFVDPDFRGQGIGARLLATSLGVLREDGFTHCTLHWISGNPLGRRFWMQHGFEPVEYLARRIVDERILWADCLGSED